MRSIDFEENHVDATGFAGIAILLSEHREDQGTETADDDSLFNEFTTDNESEEYFNENDETETMSPIGFSGIAILLENGYGDQESVNGDQDSGSLSETKNNVEDNDRGENNIELPESTSNANENGRHPANSEDQESNNGSQTNIQPELPTTNRSDSVIGERENHESGCPVGFMGIAKLVTEPDEIPPITEPDRRVNITSSSENTLRKREIEEDERETRNLFMWLLGVTIIVLFVIGVARSCDSNSTSTISSVGRSVSDTPSSRTNYSSQMSPNNRSSSAGVIATQKSNSRVSSSGGSERVSQNSTTLKNDSRQLSSDDGDSVSSTEPRAQSKLYSFPSLEIPPVGTDYTLTSQQIQYCLANKVRIESARSKLEATTNKLIKKFDLIGYFERADRVALMRYGGWRGEYLFYWNNLSFLYDNWVNELGRFGTLGDTLHAHLVYTKNNFKRFCEHSFNSVSCRTLRSNFETVMTEYKNYERSKISGSRMRFNYIVGDYNRRCLSYKYYTSDKKTAQAAIEPMLQKIEAEGRNLIE